jgi:hypothetical protein
MSGDSTTATLVESLRLHLTERHTGRMPSVLANGVKSDALGSIALASPAPWRVAGAVPVLHALSSLGINFLDGITLPGYGDAFTLHVQYPGYSQSFRAVWDVGNWDAGGIDLPLGESGEPGSPHYLDGVTPWLRHDLTPLPFSDAALARAATATLTLTP